MVVPSAVITSRTPPDVYSSVIAVDAAPSTNAPSTPARAPKTMTVARKRDIVDLVEAGGPEGPPATFVFLSDACRTQRCASDSRRERTGANPHPGRVEERVRDSARNRDNRRLARAQRKLVGTADEHVRDQRCVLEAQDRVGHPVQARDPALVEVDLLEDPAEPEDRASRHLILDAGRVDGKARVRRVVDVRRTDLAGLLVHLDVNY